MSHNVKIEGVQIADLDALQDAINELQSQGIPINLERTADSFRTYRGQENQCDAAIMLSGANHDIGLRKKEDGTYDIVFDPYSEGRQGIGSFLGVPGANTGYGGNARASIGKLLQAYAVCKVEREAAMQGYMTTRDVNAENGAISVSVEGM